VVERAHGVFTQAEPPRDRSKVIVAKHGAVVHDADMGPRKIRAGTPSPPLR